MAAVPLKMFVFHVFLICAFKPLHGVTSLTMAVSVHQLWIKAAFHGAGMQKLREKNKAVAVFAVGKVIIARDCSTGGLAVDVTSSSLSFCVQFKLRLIPAFCLWICGFFSQEFAFLSRCAGQYFLQILLVLKPYSMLLALLFLMLFLPSLLAGWDPARIKCDPKMHKDGHNLFPLVRWSWDHSPLGNGLCWDTLPGCNFWSADASNRCIPGAALCEDMLYRRS